MSQLKMLFSKMFVLFLFAVMVAVMESRQAFRYILTYLILHIFCTKVGEQVTRQCWPWCDPGAGFIGIPRKIMALKNLKAIIIDLNYIKGKLFFLDLTGE